MKSEDLSAVVPSLIAQDIEILACPLCGGALNVSGDRCRIECSKCDRSFRCQNGIPLLFCANGSNSKIDVTETVKSFYEEHPFPNYEDIDSQQTLKEKAEKGIFARLLDEQILLGTRILEVGCGTGQLSNFLGMKWGRNVYATDMCVESLRLGEEFRKRQKIDDVAFLQMNLFRPVFRDESFDLVICNGVLHHTSDPFLGFQSISRLVRRGGFIIVGLYNSYGRIPTDIRRLIFRLSANRFISLDSRLKDKGLADKRKHSWFMDQYRNPHESKHTIGEVLSWFDQSGMEFINSIPHLRPFKPFSQSESLFNKNPLGTNVDHFFVQLGLLLSGGREGGFFMMIGRKKF